ncbi:hypothetical protein BNJ_00442 [Kaumoebavirus]|uniref:hypothetical protein n=1 Tax=Kaumoebavirus TaxID=1859492 RepID=UPI0009C2ED69|nr:hypothetical protein BNJ_00442 [Kaumoebavirus]ARA72254.1 hypothetical protein BNJ_00442 [Kaumoebavirus]
MRARRLAPPEAVEALDKRVPKEITDEILTYVCRGFNVLPFEVEYGEDNFRDIFTNDYRYAAYICKKCGMMISGALGEIDDIDLDEDDEDDEDDEGCQNYLWEYGNDVHECGKKDNDREWFCEKLRRLWGGKIKSLSF